MHDARVYEFCLPLPLSVNEAYRSGGKADKARYLTAEAKAWKQLAQYSLKGTDRIDGPVRLELVFYFKRRYQQDVANYEKMLTDALVTKGVIQDDRYIVSLAIEKTVAGRPRVEGRVISLGQHTDRHGCKWD